MGRRLFGYVPDKLKKGAIEKMSNHFPTYPSGYHVQNLQYCIQAFYEGLPIFNQDPVPVISFNFDTGFDESGNPTYSYGSFDQDSAESEIESLASSALSIIGEGDGTYSLLRIWTMEANSTISGAYGQDGFQVDSSFAPVISWSEAVTGTPEWP